jgi:hypothetical protein
MNRKQKRQEECKARLLEFIQPGDTIYTKLNHVSRSGMYRVISLYVMKDNRPRRIDDLACDLLEGYDYRHNGCKASGCGMDMGFHLVYNLSYQLFPDGVPCTGPGCNSNDHSNRPWPSRDGTMHHRDGGSALNQSWL